MSTQGNHAEDMEHDLEHVGREVGEAFAGSVTPSATEEEEKVIESHD